jgi:hypothetical protein
MPDNNKNVSPNKQKTNGTMEFLCGMFFFGATCHLRHLFCVFFPRQFSSPFLFYCALGAKKEKKIATIQKLPVNVCGPAKLPPRTTPENNWHHHFFSGKT